MDRPPRFEGVAPAALEDAPSSTSTRHCGGPSSGDGAGDGAGAPGTPDGLEAPPGEMGGRRGGPGIGVTPAASALPSDDVDSWLSWWRSVGDQRQPGGAGATRASRRRDDDDCVASCARAAGRSRLLGERLKYAPSRDIAARSDIRSAMRFEHDCRRFVLDDALSACRGIVRGSSCPSSSEDRPVAWSDAWPRSASAGPEAHSVCGVVRSSAAARARCSRCAGGCSDSTEAASR